MNNILCSIIIPYYNIPHDLVNKCLISILNQNWDGNNYEVIFINDGSTLPIDDSTTEILSKFNKSFLIEQDNKGLSTARNSGIKRASGDYIFFVDSDDYWFTNKIGDLIPHLKRKEHDIIKFQSVHIFDNGKIRVPRSKAVTTECSSGCEYMSKHNIIMGACTYCYRTAFLKEQSIFMPEGIIHEDEWFLTMAFFRAGKCLFTQIPLYAYIRRDGSIMSINSPQKWELHLNNLYSIIKDTLRLKDNVYSLQNEALNNRLSFLLYVYCFYILKSSLSDTQKQYYFHILQSISLYPLPDIGKSRMYKILRLCSKSNFTLKLFTKAVQAINKKRVDGKIY